MLIRHYPFTARITAIKSSRPRYDLCVMEATTRMFDDVKFRSANNNDNHKVKTLTYSGEADLWSRNHDVIKPALRKNEAVKLYYSESPENDDEDDDVFAPEDPEDGLSKPLMYPRQRTKVKTVRPSGRAGKVLRCAACIGLSVSMVVAAAWLIAYVHSHKKHLFQSQNISAVTGCSHIDTEDVWIMKLPKLTTESAIRMMDVNNDKVLDVILGFATGANGYSGTENLCDVYFNGTQLCQGGLLALDGRSGEEIWRHYMDNEIFALNCDEDLNTDGLNECLTSGRHGTLEAVNMKAGSTLWTFDQKENKEARVDVMNIYTALYVMDLDGDGVADIVIMQGGDPLAKPGQSDRLAGRLLVLSGQTGHVLQWVETPDGRESYYSPVMTIRRDGTPMILFGTGGETNGGALWHITLGDLYKGDIRKARTIYTDAFKGVMTPPALVDITGDGVCDIVFASFNSTVVAIDGDTYKLLWSFSYPSSETYMTPAPGFYNDDDTPDFLIHYQYGPGYPVYYHAITTVLDGRSGKPLVKPYIHSTTGTQVSPLTVSTAGVGNDVFLHWMDDCMGHEGEGTPYSFLEGTNEHIKSHADLCQLRFDSSAVNRLYAHGQHFMPPGVPIYDSAERITMETAGWVDTAAEGENFLRAHPGLQGAAEASHQMQDPQHSAATQQSAATARRQFFRNHPGVTGRKHLPRFRDWPAKSRAKMQEPQLETSRKLQHEYRQPNWKYKQPDRNQDYFSHHGNTQSQQRLEEDAYPQLAGLASNFGGQNYYGRNKPAAGQQGFKPQSVLDERYGVQKRNFNGDRREGVQGERDTRKRGKRKKRDAGTSGAGTVQKSLSTGTLAPSSLPPTHPDYHHSIDVVFATYRFHPSDAVVILPSDQPCIDQILATRPFRFDPTDGLDVEAYRQRVIRTCLERRGKGSVNINLHPSQSDPYHAQMGQTVVYRIRLKCTCEMRNSTSDQETCGQVLPYDQQAWSAYMGSSGTGHWHPPPPPVQ